MLFIRTTLLLGLGVLVLPTDEASQVRVMGGAKTALTWTMTFCDRNPATCDQGQQGWALFKKKAEFAAKMAVDLIAERNSQTAEAPAAQKPAAVMPTAEPAAKPRGTLKPGDLEPAWRGKMARVGG
jgi:Family of unknown function (DUF5330)